MTKKTLYHLSAFLLVLALMACKKETLPTPLLLPHDDRSEVKYVCYITNDQRELQHDMTYLSRFYVRTDSSTGKHIHYYIENNKLIRYYGDDDGTLWQEVKLDLAVYALNAGYPYREPIPFSYWKPIFRKKQGFGSEWDVNVDTTYTVDDSTNQPHEFQFTFAGEARLDGWTDLIVPARRDSALRVLNVHWKSFTQSVYDRTAKDSVWVQRGEGREFFHPQFGLARSMSDYTVMRKNQAPVSRKSTMDLYYMLIPNR